MFATDSFLTFSFPAGRLFGVPLRLSFLLPVVVMAVMWRLQNPVFGLIVGFLLLLSLMIHEVAHLVVARRADHYPGTIVLWPLGGLHSAALPSDFQASILMALAGPAANLSIAAACGWELHNRGQLTALLNPFAVFAPVSPNNLPDGILRATFVINWCLGIFNLVPVRPLDAGQAFLSFLNLRFADSESRDLLIRIGLVFSLLGLLAGFVFDVSGLVALSAFLLVLHIHEATRWHPGADFLEDSELDDEDEDFDRYDSSDASDHDSEQPSGIMERWRSRRDEERSRREADQLREDEAQLDHVLEKLHSKGRDSLSPREVSLLNRISARLREKHVRE